MQLDFLDNINDFGEDLIRLYDFKKAESILFTNLVQDIIINQNQKLDLSTVSFIEPRNCNLILQITTEDEGIVTANKKQFYCNLTLASYKNMVKLLQPFCTKETKGYQFLYDVDCPIDFMFTPYGTW